MLEQLTVLMTLARWWLVAAGLVPAQLEPMALRVPGGIALLRQGSYHFFVAPSSLLSASLAHAPAPFETQSASPAVHPDGEFLVRFQGQEVEFRVVSSSFAPAVDFGTFGQNGVFLRVILE